MLTIGIDRIRKATKRDIFDALVSVYVISLIVGAFYILHGLGNPRQSPRYGFVKVSGYKKDFGFYINFQEDGELRSQFFNQTGVPSSYEVDFYYMKIFKLDPERSLDFYNFERSSSSPINITFELRQISCSEKQLENITRKSIPDWVRLTINLRGNGKRYRYWVYQNDKIREFAVRYYTDFYAYTNEKQPNLYFNGVQLNSNLTFADYNFCEYSVIDFVME